MEHRGTIDNNIVVTVRATGLGCIFFKEILIFPKETKRKIFSRNHPQNVKIRVEMTPSRFRNHIQYTDMAIGCWVANIQDISMTREL